MRSIGKHRHDLEALAHGIIAAHRDLIIDRAITLQVGRKSGVDRGAKGFHRLRECSTTAVSAIARSSRRTAALASASMIRAISGRKPCEDYRDARASEEGRKRMAWRL
jgi:hypothetical protein